MSSFEHALMLLEVRFRIYELGSTAKREPSVVSAVSMVALNDRRHVMSLADLKPNAIRSDFLIPNS